jgi:hypothetical protein
MSQMSCQSRIRLALVCLLLAALSPKASVGQTVTLQSGTPAVSGGNGSFALFLPILNAGTAAAASVTVKSATLGRLSASGSLPLPPTDILVGKVSFVNLTFNSGTLVIGFKYLLTIRGTYTLAGTEFGFAINRFILLGAPDIFQKPANPITVTPLLDSSHSIQALISSAKGGTLTATGADGSIFTLTIPPNDLLSDEVITMTPIVSIGDIPLSGGFAAGIDLQPQGLRLLVPATLTITSPATAAPGQQWGFSYSGSGADFHIYPLNLGATITMNILHFTGFGWGMAPSLGSTLEAAIALQTEARVEQQVAQLTQQERARELNPNNPQPPSLDPQYLENMATLLQQEYTDVVQPLIDAAMGDDGFLQKASEIVTGWEKQVELLDLDGQEPFASEVAATKSALVQLIVKFHNNAFARCLAPDGVAVAESANMLEAFRELTLLDQTALLPNFNTQVAACMAGSLQLTFDSTIIGELAEQSVGNLDTTSHVLATDVPLQFDTTKLQYFGTGPLAYESFSGVIHWVPPLSDCGSSFSGIPGTIDVTGVIDLNVNGLSIKQASDVEILLTTNPSVSELILARGIGPKVPCTTGPLPVDLYTAYYIFLHVTTQLEQFANATPLPYPVFVNTPKLFAFQGTGPLGGAITESTLVTLVNP